MSGRRRGALIRPDGAQQLSIGDGRRWIGREMKWAAIY